MRNVEMSAPAEMGEEEEEDEEDDEGSEGSSWDSWDKSHETRSRSCGLYRWLNVSQAFCTECVFSILFVPRVRIRRPNLKRSRRWRSRMAWGLSCCTTSRIAHPLRRIRFSPVRRTLLGSSTLAASFSMWMAFKAEAI